MINPSLYKSIKDQSGVESLLVLDDKGFVTYNSQGSKQQGNTHNYYELYQLSKYFYPQSQNNPIIGIQTGSHITMIRAQQTIDGEQKIIVMKQRIVDTAVEGNQNI